MIQHPMTEQVARVMGNLLAEGTAVYLPDVGSLYVERQAARRISARSVMPPCRTVAFSSQPRGVSLVDEIARTIREADEPSGDPAAESAGEARQRARDIYDRWLARSMTEGTLAIEGVGVLRFKHFTPDAAFDARLNPYGHEPVKMPRRRFDWTLWTGVAAIAAALSIGVYHLWSLRTVADDPQMRAEEPVLARTDRDPFAGDADAGVDAAVDAGGPSVDAGSSGEPAATASAAASGGGRVGGSGTEVSLQPAGTGTRSGTADSDAPARLTSGRNYVVLGVFSSSANAVRAAHDAEQADGAFRCGIYRFGDKLLVSPFESEDREACTLFIRAHAEAFPGMWTYSAR